MNDLVPLRTVAYTWFLISLQTFGGPAGQIAVMQRVLVDQKRWIGQRRFLHALNYCMMLPGPEASSWPLTPAGCSTGFVADWSPAHSSCFPVCSSAPFSVWWFSSLRPPL